MYIGVQGFIGSGKDTASRYIESKESFVKDSFANTLKDVCAIMFSWPRELLEGDSDVSRAWREQPDPWWSKKLNIPNFTPRYALQQVGTEIFRENFHQDTWLLTFQYRMEHKHVGKNVIISDCRFPNEVNFFQNAGGKIIFIDSGVKPEWYEYALEANNGSLHYEKIMKEEFSHVHRSEWAWVGITPDITVMNDFNERDENTLNKFLKRVDDSLIQFK